ncbi:MAG: ATP-binding protein [Sphaerochaetaceae bacterium]|nr:ATP-binding protein [Sphaerochaetaceae bacterium]
MQCNIVICGYINKGFDGQLVGVEAQIRSGFPGFDIIGLPDSSIKESRERIKAAMRSSGFKVPQQRILVSLSPAGVPKAGSSLDLALAMAIALARSENKNPDAKTIKIMLAGELRLDGKTVSAPYTYGAVECARKAGCNYCIIPGEKGEHSSDEHVLTADSFLSAFSHITGIINNSDNALNSYVASKRKENVLFSDILGLSSEKMSLTYSAAGFHSLLVFGPPGTGKTLLCSRLHRLLPQHTREEQETLIRIYGCAGLEIEDPSAAGSRFIPHDCSLAQFVGGAASKSPGEGALAYGGVIILDELDKYSKKLIEAVKDTYDKGYTASSKSGELTVYPARFIMAANMNPCPCGGLGKEEKVCTCSALQIQNHWNKLGKAFMERFDIRIPVSEQNTLDLINEESLPDSYYINIVESAISRQKFRFSDTPEIKYNGHVRLYPSALKKFEKEIELLKKLDLVYGGTRNMLGMVTLARTIADCHDRDSVTEEDFEKALQLRRYGTGDYYWRSVNFDHIKIMRNKDE